MNTEFDVVIIGAGPAGYVAAIRCAQLGLSTACIDKWLDEEHHPRLGGTCLNVGCIPSKALLESSHIYAQSAHHLSLHGIEASGLTLNLQKMMDRKNKVVKTLTSGIEALFKSHKITWIQGFARIENNHELLNKQVLVHQHNKQNIKLKAANIIIATGSSPVDLSIAPVDHDYIVDSTGALSFNEAPQKLGIIGAGVIGLELGSVWRRLGSEVTIFEALDNFLAIADPLIARESLKIYRKQGLDIQLNTRLLGAQVINNQVQVSYQNKEGKQSAQFDKLIIAVGRSPNTSDLFENETELEFDEGGFIHVNQHCETSLPGIYAIGDIVRGPMLAHKGSEEGLMVAELIAGHFREVNYNLIPSVIYTHPEIAWVGKNEQQLKTAGIDYHSGTFPFVASGRAQAVSETAGMIKVLADSITDRILGVHILGVNASEIIAQAVIAMELGASAEDIALSIFAHPTLSEAFHEAALAVSGNALHIAQKRK